MAKNFLLLLLKVSLLSTVFDLPLQSVLATAQRNASLVAPRVDRSGSGETGALSSGSGLSPCRNPSSRSTSPVLSTAGQDGRGVSRERNSEKSGSVLNIATSPANLTQADEGSAGQAEIVVSVPTDFRTSISSSTEADPFPNSAKYSKTVPNPRMTASRPTTVSTSSTTGFEKKGAGCPLSKDLWVILLQEAREFVASNYTLAESSRRQLNRTAYLLQITQSNWELIRVCNTTAEGTNRAALHPGRLWGELYCALEGAEVLYEILKGNCCNKINHRKRNDGCSQTPCVLPEFSNAPSQETTVSPAQTITSKSAEDSELVTTAKRRLEQVKLRFSKLIEACKSTHEYPHMSRCDSVLGEGIFATNQSRQRVTAIISSAVTNFVQYLEDCLHIGILLADLKARNQNDLQSRLHLENGSAGHLEVSFSVNVALTSLKKTALDASDCKRQRWCADASEILSSLESIRLLRGARIKSMAHSLFVLCGARSSDLTTNTSKTASGSESPRLNDNFPSCPASSSMCTKLLNLKCSNKQFVCTKRALFSFSVEAMVHRYVSKVLGNSFIAPNASSTAAPVFCRLSCSLGRATTSLQQALTVSFYISDGLCGIAFVLSIYLLLVSKRNRLRMTRNPRRPYLYLCYLFTFVHFLQAAGRYVPKDGFWCNSDGSLVMGSGEANLFCRTISTLTNGTVVLRGVTFLWAVRVWLGTVKSAENTQRVTDQVVLLGLTKDELLEVGVTVFSFVSVAYCSYFGAAPPIFGPLLDDIEGSPAMQSCVAGRRRYSQVSALLVYILVMVVGLSFLSFSLRFEKISARRNNSIRDIASATGHQDREGVVLKRWPRRHLVFFLVGTASSLIGIGNFIYISLATENPTSFQQAMTDYAACRSRLVCPDRCLLKVPPKSFAPFETVASAVGPVLNVNIIITNYLWLFFEEIEWMKLSKIRGKFTL